MSKSMFDIIKKQNGEHFAKAIRNYDNGIFDIPNLDKIVKYAGRDAEPIMNYLVSLKNIQIEEMAVHRNPIELLSMAGYDAYIADTLEKQNAIKKYYANGEELCTFRDPHRFEKYYMINAVRKDVNKIKRSEKPEREDEYGTSVISIQVLKTGGFISIKNRYNHTVENPDNTLNSNPDNIIPGLSDAIKHYFNVDFSAQNVQLPTHYTIINNQICKYNQEIDNTYFGTDFYAKDGVFYQLDNNSELMLGNGLILNLATKKVKCLASRTGSYAIGPYDLEISIEDIIRDKKIRIEKNATGKKTVFADNVRIIDVVDGMITYINAPNAYGLCLRDTKLEGDLDFSNVAQLNLNGANLSKCTSIKFNPNARFVHLGGCVLGGDLDLSNVQDLNLGDGINGDFSNVRNFKLPPQYALFIVDIQNANNIDKNLDFHNVSRIGISNSDLSKANLVLNPNVQILSLDNVKGLHDSLNFDKVGELYLLGSDLSQLSELRTNPHARVVQIRDTKGISGRLDFSDVSFVQLERLDLANVTELKFGSNTSVELIGCKNLSGEIDLSKVKNNATISETDFSNVTSLKLPSSLNDSLNGIIAPRGVFNISNIKSSRLNFKHADLSRVSELHVPNSLTSLDFSHATMPILEMSLSSDITWLYCQNTDFSKTQKITLSGKIENLIMQDAVGLHGDLDFSNVTRLDLTYADLSHVHSMKFNSKGFITGLKPKDKLRFALVGGVDKIKQKFSKSDKTKVIKNESREM